MSPQPHEIFREAIARNAAAVLSLPSAGMLRHYKTRLLAEQTDGATHGFWIECPNGEHVLIDSLIAANTPAGMSFRADTKRIAFTATILRREPKYRINAETTLHALFLEYPQEVQAIQRRNDYRVHVPASTELLCRAWRIAEHVHLADRPMAAQHLSLELRDISIGGMGVTLLPKKNEPLRTVAGERWRVELRYGELTLLLEARLLYPECARSTEPIRAGVQFKKLDKDLDGRQKLAALTRIVGELQRQEVRRLRLGMAG